MIDFRRAVPVLLPLNQRYICFIRLGDRSTRLGDYLRDLFAGQIQEEPARDGRQRRKRSRCAMPFRCSLR